MYKKKFKINFQLVYSHIHLKYMKQFLKTLISKIKALQLFVLYPTTFHHFFHFKDINIQSEYVE